MNCLSVLWLARIDGVAPDPYADPDGPARLSTPRPEIPYRSERGGDEHLDDEGAAVAQPDPAAAAGRRRTTAGNGRVCDSGSLSSGLSRACPASQRTRSA